jgi:hypothetical protein
MCRRAQYKQRCYAVISDDPRKRCDKILPGELSAARPGKKCDYVLKNNLEWGNGGEENGCKPYALNPEVLDGGEKDQCYAVLGYCEEHDVSLNVSGP